MNHVPRILLVVPFLVGFAAVLIPRSVLRGTRDKIFEAGRWLDGPAPRNRAAAFIIIWVVALIPMLHVTNLVRHYAVEVPTLDDWEMAPLIAQAHTGRLPWAQIFAQQQEGRTVLPKLIFILSASGGHWDVRDQMMLSVVCCWVTAAGVFILLRRSGLGLIPLAVCFWLAVLTIFTTAQFELWIFASGFPSFLPALFLVAALVVLETHRLSTATKFVLCGLLAVASSFTLPHGLLAWGLMFPMLLVMRRVPRWRWWLTGWAALCALCAVAYFWQYQKPKDLPTFAPAASALEYARFILEFLGGSLAYALKFRPDLSATIFGALQVAFFLAVLVFSARRVRDRVFIAKAAPWCALALYSFSSAFLAALGRVAYGARYALASRYVTFSIYLVIALVVLGAIMIQEMAGRPRSIRWRGWSYGICGVLILAYLVPYKVCAFNTTFFLRALSAKDRLAHAAILFSPAIDTSEVIKATAYPNDARPAIEGADTLDRLKLLRPPLVRDRRLDALPHEVADGTRASGACEAIKPVGNNFLRATGWAALAGKGRPADCVAIAYQTVADSSWTLFAISDSFAMRAEIVKRFGTMEQLWSGWSATFPSSAVPAGAKISFWAVDADEPHLYELKDESGATAR